jgi:sulfite reductase alpha subunit-like flavoprotein
MFDNYYPQRTNVVYESSNVSVTHKHAPTDESVKMLKQLEAEALAKIVNSIRVENTTFSCVIHSYSDNLYCVNKFMVIFKLNGKQIYLPISISDIKTRDETAQMIWQKIAERIAAEITADLSKVFMNLSFM